MSCAPVGGSTVAESRLRRRLRSFDETLTAKPDAALVEYLHIPERFISPLQNANIRFGEIWFTWQDVLTLVCTLLLFGALWLVLNRTRLGALVRCVAEDPKLAQLFGIDAARVYIGVFVFECAAVALGAGLVAPRSPILASIGFDEVIMTFVVVVLGGIGSVGGSLLAGLGLTLGSAADSLPGHGERDRG